MQLPKQLILFAVILSVIRSPARSQTTGSPAAGPPTAGSPVAGSLRQKLAGLSLQYHHGVLSDTAYLKAIDSAAGLLVKEDSLPQLLKEYQQIAFGDPRWGVYRATYYTYLAFHAYNMNRYGAAIFYSEKNQEERVRAGLDAPMRIPRSDLFAITVYYNNRNYAKVFSKYHALRPELQELSGTVADGAVSRAQAYVALAILNSVVYAAYRTGDSSLANEGIGITEKMLGEIRGLPGKYKGDTTLYNYIYHTMLYDREKYRDHTDRGAAGRAHFTRAGEFLQMAIREVRSGDFPPNYQPAYTEELYGDAFDFYFDHGKKDSARLYLDRVRAMNDSLVKYSSMDRSFQLESSSKLLAANGEYRAAYDDLLNVYRVKDSAFYAVSTDKENNLYALAEADNSRSELLRAEVARRKAEQSTLFLSVLLTFLVLGGIAGFLVYRSRQRQRLLNWQLQLARDFHDEIGPQLLYAGILLKKEAEAHPSERLEELKGQVSNIMEAVRGISHDLKSNEPGTVGTFYKEIATLLEKIRASTHIDFTIRMNNGQRVLNHWQYTHLHKMLNELIGNSIKHAGCSRIAVKIMAAERELRINYSDDGKGMEPGVSAAGIGLRNMEERAVLLKGHFRLENAWPEGYSVDISIPLV